MVYAETKLRLKDNSGGINVKCIKTLKSSKRKGLKPLGLAVVSVRRIQENKNKIEKGKIYQSILIRKKKNWTRLNGDAICFQDNSVILINERGLPYASRIRGPVYKEFRSKFLTKVLLLSNFST